MTAHSTHEREEGRGTHLGDYWPLGCLVVVTALAALAINTGFPAMGSDMDMDPDMSPNLSMKPFMHAYMGVFLVVFSLLKLFDPGGFKDGFAMYDLLARRIPAYGYLYPLIELGLGLAYLAHFMPQFVYLVTILVFSFGTLGVVQALRQGLDIDCPCMGNVLSVPLSTVTLTEDIAMVIMAALLLSGI